MAVRGVGQRDGRVWHGLKKATQIHRALAWGFPLLAYMAITLCSSSWLWSQSEITKDFPRVDWTPTMAPAGSRYAGSEACAACHTREAASQPLTPMAHALELPANSQVLRDHPRLTFRQGPYVYEIQKEKNGDIRYNVSDGARMISVPIRWALGYGMSRVGQTYVFEYRGRLLESRVSYFSAIQALDITMGHRPEVPASLEAALGNLIPESFARRCFSCHATAAVSDGSLRLDKMIPGIICEGCHGPGEKHIAAVEAGNLKDLHIFNPGSLATGDLTDFCGSCHRTSAQITSAGIHGVNSVPFQSYRLARSRCYDRNESRIGCLACHNPHQAANRNAAFYDAKCLACHDLHPKAASARSASSARSCPVAKSQCVTCHMPKVEVPQSHHAFTDHWIRVAKAGEPYPK